MHGLDANINVNFILLLSFSKCSLLPAKISFAIASALSSVHHIAEFHPCPWLCLYRVLCHSSDTSLWDTVNSVHMSTSSGLLLSPGKWLIVFITTPEPNTVPHNVWRQENVYWIRMDLSEKQTKTSFLLWHKSKPMFSKVCGNGQVRSLEQSERFSWEWLQKCPPAGQPDSGLPALACGK